MSAWQPVTIVGIAGAKRSGKTTLANYLAETHGMLHTSFAEPIRAFVAQLLGGSLEQLEAAKEEPVAWLDGATPRHMMQTLGTEWGRQLICPELWVRFAMRKALGAGAAVLSDVRFPNEARAIREHGGIVIRVNRAGSAATDSHISEVPLPDDLVDFELYNGGTFESLYANAESCMEHAQSRATCMRREG
jgi:hypothetical protein